MDGDGTYIHIVGGSAGLVTTSTHLKIKMSELLKEETEIEKQWIEEEAKVEEIEKQHDATEWEIRQINTDIQHMKKKILERTKLQVKSFSSKKKKKNW
ncbi:hypothetical protein RFI_13344 [Reticulomyxa filosa]|uniref:Uncharacterized protein n=1 Tax=Reticulomyxa filosa TaxID=46433 RepID=X6ND51_RETFI|nr:hypothetical protein RFI_13344 [Reticulomyxa filosa]|eukprot:ETO23823.1 hypothetical protein RFI_13344 [Reticulomyxa filosa]